jgi:tripartite-type tricarboxylate transporter receptor subunit TctC
MKLSRRRILRLAAGAAALPLASRITSAQTYPSRPVRIVVGFAAGGTVDIFARLIGQWLSERLGQPYIIENRPGATGNAAAAAVVKASPDGYTLLALTSVNAINATLYDNLDFDLIHDIAPVASVASGQGVMEVNPAFPARNVPEFIAYAKANPGTINMASGGAGSSQHIYGELFKSMTGVNMVHVPYRGTAPALPDLFSGQVQVMFDPLASSIEHIRAGKLRALAVTSAVRSDLLPDIPTIGESVPGYEATGWQAVGAPKSTPGDIMDKINKEINVGLATPMLKARIADLGYTAFASSRADFGKFVADETAKWGKVIRAANIKL